MITLVKSALHKQGGLEKYTWQIARDFCALGVEVKVLTSGPVHDPHLCVVSLPVKKRASFLNVLQFDNACAEYLEKHPTPIVFGLDRNRFQTHIRAGNGVHAAYLQRRSAEEGFFKRMSFAINPLHRAILQLERKAFEHPGLEVLFTNSEMVKQEVLRFYNTDPSKIVVVHNGVEWKAMQKDFEAWEEKKEALDAFQFLFIGHNFMRKGLKQLLQALSHIKTEHFQLNVVGKDKHSKYFQELADTLGLGKKVKFHGPQASAVPFYQCADCTVIPSLYDPFANVTVESLAMGVPVLSSKHNGGHEVLTPHNGSVIASIDDATAFAEQLRGILSKRKTADTALAVRNSVQHLDFSRQLRSITQRIIGRLGCSCFKN